MGVGDARGFALDGAVLAIAGVWGTDAVGFVLDPEAEGRGSAADTGWRMSINVHFFEGGRGMIGGASRIRVFDSECVVCGWLEKGHGCWEDGAVLWISGSWGIGCQEGFWGDWWFLGPCWARGEGWEEGAVFGTFVGNGGVGPPNRTARRSVPAGKRGEAGVSVGGRVWC